MKIKRKLNPFLSCDVCEIEDWLCGNAKDGLLYKESGMLFAKFEISEPRNRRFRLEYADVVGSHIREEKQQLIEECGWTVADDIKSDLVVLYTDDENAPEPYTEAKSAEKPLKALAKRQNTLGLVFLLLFLLSPIGAVINSEGALLSNLLYIGTARCAVIFLTAILILCEAILRFVRAKRLKAKIEILRTDGELPHSEKRKRNFWGKLLVPITIPLVILFCVEFVFSVLSGSKSYMQFYDEDIAFPFLRLEEIYGDEWNSTEQNDLLLVYKGHDILAPRMLSIQQNMTRESDYAKSHMTAEYSVDYYEMRSSALAERYEKECVKSYTELSRSQMLLWTEWYQKLAKEKGTQAANDFLHNIMQNNEVTSSEQNGVSVISIEDREHGHSYSENFASFQVLIIRYENKIEIIRYMGDKDTNDFIAEYVALIQ